MNSEKLNYGMRVAHGWVIYRNGDKAAFNSIDELRLLLKGLDRSAIPEIMVWGNGPTRASQRPIVKLSPGRSQAQWRIANGLRVQ